MMVNFQIKHQDKMVKGYITAESNSNLLYTIVLYFVRMLFHVYLFICLVGNIYQPDEFSSLIRFESL